MVIDRELYYREHAMLREELHNLKECQVRILTLSVTVTSALLGLAASLARSVPGAYLFPLTILIPCWWIFFDKATTITRIVGYYRILERAILKPDSVKCFIGWENALAEFRKLQCADRLTRGRDEKSPEKSPIYRFLELVVLKTTHRYWMLVYYTFFGLSALCIVLSFLYSAKKTYMFVIIASIIVMISAFWNIWIVWQLIWGRFSYTSNEQFWMDILGVEDAQNEHK